MKRVKLVEGKEVKSTSAVVSGLLESIKKDAEFGMLESVKTQKK